MDSMFSFPDLGLTMAFSTETSRATLAVPPTHPDEHSMDSVMRQSQVENASKEKNMNENASKEKNVNENASDKSLIMITVEVSSRKKRKRKRTKRQAQVENVNPLMRVSQEENGEEVQNMIGKATDGTIAVANEEVSSRKKNRKRKRRKKRCHNIQCQEENQGKDPNKVEKATDGSPAVASAEVKIRKKKNRGKRRRKTRHDSLQSNANISGVSKDCPKETNGKNNLIQEGSNSVEDKIGEHFKGSNLPSTGPLASHQDTAGEVPISTQQVEAVSSPVNALPAGQFNHDPDMEPLEQLQQLASAEPFASNPDTSGGLLNSSQQVEPVCHQDVAQANGLNHESLVQEFPQQMLQLPPAESPNSTHDPSVATEIELRSNDKDSLSGHSPPAEPSNSTHLPSMATEIELGSNNEDSLSVLSPPAEPPNSTHNPSMSAEIELRSNNEDSLSDHAPRAPMEITNQAVVHPSSNSELDSHTPVGAFRTQSLDTRNVFTPSEINNHLRQTAIQSMNLSDDPLKNELERLCKESEQNMKYYEDMKLRLKSDCEREIEETRRKYDNKLQESEFEFQLKKKNMDTNLNLVMMNKTWAEAFRCECMDLVSGAPGMLQDPSSGQQLALFSKLLSPASVLPHFAPAACSWAMAPPLISSAQILGPPMPARAPPLPAAYSAPPWPPHINSIFPPLPNHQAVGLPRPNLLAREPAMDVNCQLGRNLPNTMLCFASRAQDDSVRPAKSPDIVCLSDDD